MAVGMIGKVDVKCKKVYKGVEKVGKRCRKGVKIHLFLPNLSYDTYNHLMTIILPLDKLCIHLSTESAKVNVYQDCLRKNIHGYIILLYLQSGDMMWRLYILP